LLRSSSVPSDSVVHTGDVRLIKGIGEEVIRVPLVEINLQSNSVSNTVCCGLLDTLPEGVDFLLGNDIWCQYTESHTVDNLVVTRSGRDTETHSSVVENAVDSVKSLFDSALSTNGPVIDNSDRKDLHNIAQHDDSTHDQQGIGDQVGMHYGDIDLCSVTSRKDFVALQQQDVSVKHLFQKVEHEPYPVGKSYLYVKDDMLLRHYVTANHDVDYEQLVVPTTLRNKILHIAHDIPASGHLGVRKTTQRLQSHFW